MVPRGLHEMCLYVLTHAEVKGIFRKAGSGEKQERIKNVLETCGKLVGGDLDVLDVAVVIKYFLKMLPTPLIPAEYQNLFLACEEHADRRDVLVLSCLLLPVENLNLLTYIMQFLDQVASHSFVNQMNAYNIAVCVGPNIMPVYKQELVKKVVTIVKVLIENSDLIGTVPEVMRKVPIARKKTICQKIIEAVCPKPNKSY
ncbi:inactive Rho GTPase-activating protein 11B [Leptinotarsa decemlineata]|uniref:inactive Rho GTPase-activating protein 11B n=1 Tax=Leptinotarsa decemlineata TaxID=7539 RepID=UPI003D30732C